MEYIYSALLLHSAGKEINDANVEAVLKAAGEEPDAARIKALTASLEGVDIEEAIKNAAVAAPAAAAPAAAPAAGGDAADAPAEEEEEDDGVSEEEAAEGLGALFG